MLGRWIAVALLCVAVGSIGCGSDEDDNADDDMDGVVNSADNCPQTPNGDQSDQDDDDDGDACDCSNDNDVTTVANPDTDDNPRELNLFTCGSDEIMIGVYEANLDLDTVDETGVVCAKRCDPMVIEQKGADYDMADGEYYCPTGSVVVGVSYKDQPGVPPPNDATDGATVLCLDLADPLAEPQRTENTDLNNNNNRFIELLCPEGSTAAGIGRKDSEDTANNSDALDGMTIQCRPGRWETAATQ